MLQPMTYCDVQRAFDADFPFGLKNYWKSSNLAQLSDEAIDTIVTSMEAAYRAIWSDDAAQESHIDWARSSWEAMQPYSHDSVYVNYLGDEGPERVHAAYSADHWARLEALKRKYDPENVFRNNQNIDPRG